MSDEIDDVGGITAVDPITDMPFGKFLEMLPILSTVVCGGERMRGKSDAELQAWAWGIEDTGAACGELIRRWLAAPVAPAECPVATAPLHDHPETASDVPVPVAGQVWREDGQDNSLAVFAVTPATVSPQYIRFDWLAGPYKSYHEMLTTDQFMDWARRTGARPVSG